MLIHLPHSCKPDFHRETAYMAPRSAASDFRGSTVFKRGFAQGVQKRQVITVSTREKKRPQIPVYKVLPACDNSRILVNPNRCEALSNQKHSQKNPENYKYSMGNDRYLCSELEARSKNTDQHKCKQQYLIMNLNVPIKVTGRQKSETTSSNPIFWPLVALCNKLL